MATVTGFTAARMLEMEDATVISGAVVGDDLILTTKGGTDINAGDVRGPAGPTGPAATDFEPGDLVTSMRTSKAGFLLCDGASYLRAGTYANLFAIIGTTHGAADATHFNVPDYRDKAIVGASASKPVGASGGEASHVLTATEMPVHNHGSTGNANTAHQHALTGFTASGGGAHLHSGPGGYQFVVGSLPTSSLTLVAVGAGDHGDIDVTFSNMGTDGAHSHPLDAGGTADWNGQIHTHTTQNAGSGGAHNNMPPYIAANTFIKY